MIKMSVYYPDDGGSKFDHDYYRTRHMPLIQERLGDAYLRYEIEKGLGGREPGSAPAVVAACHIYSPTLGAAASDRGDAKLPFLMLKRTPVSVFREPPERLPQRCRSRSPAARRH